MAASRQIQEKAIPIRLSINLLDEALIYETSTFDSHWRRVDRRALNNPSSAPVDR